MEFLSQAVENFSQVFVQSWRRSTVVCLKLLSAATCAFDQIAQQNSHGIAFLRVSMHDFLLWFEDQRSKVCDHVLVAPLRSNPSARKEITVHALADIQWY